MPKHKPAKDLVSLPRLVLSSGATGILLFLYPAIMFVVSRKRVADESKSLDFSALVQLGYTVVVLATCLVTIRSLPTRSLRELFRRPLCWLWLYVGCCVLSTAWSIDPLWTAWKSVQCAAFLMLVSLIAQRFKERPGDFVEYALFWALFAGVLQGSRRFLLMGVHEVTADSLHGAGSYAIGPVIFIALLLGQRKIVSLVMSVVLILATSAATFVGAAVGAIAAVPLLSRAKQIIAFFAMSTLLVTLLAVGPDPFKSILFYGKDDQAIENGNGRAIIWQKFWYHVAERPMLGAGFSAGERQIYGEEGLRILDAHNWFLSGMLGTGVAGTLWLLVFFGDWVNLATRREPMGWRAALVASSIMCTVISLFGPGIGATVDWAWLSQLLAVQMVVHAGREAATTRVGESPYESSILHKLA